MVEGRRDDARVPFDRFGPRAMLPGYARRLCCARRRQNGAGGAIQQMTWNDMNSDQLTETCECDIMAESQSAFIVRRPYMAGRGGRGGGDGGGDADGGGALPIALHLAPPSARMPLRASLLRNVSPLTQRCSPRHVSLRKWIVRGQGELSVRTTTWFG